MTRATRAPGADASWANVPGVAGPWRLTVDRYLELVDGGFFTGDDRVMLWEGQLVEKMTKNRPHVVVTLRLHDSIKPQVAGIGYLEQESPMRLRHRDDTLPEPDLKVVRGRDVDYPAEPPSSAVPSVIEVADSSLSPERNEVLKTLAIGGSPVYWVANIPARRIEVYSEPSGPSGSPGYGTTTFYVRGESAPLVLDGRTIGHVAVSDIFGDDDPWWGGMR